MRTNAFMNLAFSEPTRRSHTSAQSMPSPTAGPLTMAMVGFSMLRSFFVMAWG